MSHASAPSPNATPSKNATGKSLFVIEALLATFTRDSVDTNNGMLVLQSLNTAATWFSGERCASSLHRFNQKVL